MRSASPLFPTDCRRLINVALPASLGVDLLIRFRVAPAGVDGPSLDARIHVFHMTDRVDERGYYLLTNHTVVTLRFANIRAGCIACVTLVA